MQYFCGLFSDICDFWVQESEKFRYICLIIITSKQITLMKKLLLTCAAFVLAGLNAFADEQPDYVSTG